MYFQLLHIMVITYQFFLNIIFFEHHIHKPCYLLFSKLKFVKVFYTIVETPKRNGEKKKQGERTKVYASKQPKKKAGHQEEKESLKT